MVSIIDDEMRWCSPLLSHSNHSKYMYIVYTCMVYACESAGASFKREMYTLFIYLLCAFICFWRYKFHGILIEFIEAIPIQPEWAAPSLGAPSDSGYKRLRSFQTVTLQNQLLPDWEWIWENKCRHSTLYRIEMVAFFGCIKSFWIFFNFDGLYIFYLDPFPFSFLPCINRWCIRISNEEKLISHASCPPDARLEMPLLCGDNLKLKAVIFYYMDTKFYIVNCKLWLKYVMVLQIS